MLADQGASPSELVSPTLREPPAAAAFQMSESTPKSGTAATCEMITTCPAIVAVALRDCALVVGAAVNVTVPEPTPAAGLTDSHG